MSDGVEEKELDLSSPEVVTKYESVVGIVKRSTGRAKSRQWTEREEIALAKAWIETSYDPIHGSQQRSESLWKKIMEHFYRSIPDSDRSVHQLNSKWKTMNKKITTFAGIYNRRDLNRKSGQSDQDILIESLQEFQGAKGKRGLQKKPFTHIGAWQLLRNEQKWHQVEPMGCEFEDSAKRSKTSQTNNHTKSFEGDFEPIGVDTPQDNPLDDDIIGVDTPQDNPLDDDILHEKELSQPKQKAKKATASTVSKTQELVRIVSNMNNSANEDAEHIKRYRDEKLRMKEEIKQAKIKVLLKQAELLEIETQMKERQQKNEDLQFFIAPHDHLTGSSLSLMLEQKREVAKRWGWPCHF